MVVMVACALDCSNQRTSSTAMIAMIRTELSHTLAPTVKWHVAITSLPNSMV